MKRHSVMGKGGGRRLGKACRATCHRRRVKASLRAHFRREGEIRQPESFTGGGGRKVQRSDGESLDPSGAGAGYATRRRGGALDGAFCQR